MPATYEKIATTTLGSAVNEIDFSAISGSYTDLRLIFTMNGQSVASGTPFIRFNLDSGSNYSQTVLAGQGTVAASAQQTNITKIDLGTYTAPQTSQPTFITVDMFSYSNSTNKTCLITWSNDYNGGGSTERAVGLYRSTSAITAIKLKAASTNTFNIGTTATLYGILKA